MLRKDKRPVWRTKKIPIKGNRVTHYWDGNQVIGKQYGRYFERPGVVAWDIFYLYGADTKIDTLFQPWVSMGRTIIGAKDKLKIDFEALIKTPQ